MNALRLRCVATVPHYLSQVYSLVLLNMSSGWSSAAKAELADTWASQTLAHCKQFNWVTPATLKRYMTPVPELSRSNDNLFFLSFATNLRQPQAPHGRVASG